MNVKHSTSNHRPHEQQLISEKRLTFIIIVLTIAILWAGYGLWKTLSGRILTDDELQTAKTEYLLAQQRHYELLEQYQLVKDPTYLEEIARRDYLYSKPGEIVFYLGDEMSEFDQSMIDVKVNDED